MQIFKSHSNLPIRHPASSVPSHISRRMNEASFPFALSKNYTRVIGIPSSIRILPQEINLKFLIFPIHQVTQKLGFGKSKSLMITPTVLWLVPNSNPTTLF